MSNTLKFGNGQWATKEGSTLAYNDENNNFKPLPFNFERGSSATVVNKDGLIETVGSDMPRIDYKDDSEGALLLEPQSTNLLPYSEDFNSWTSSNLTLTSGQSSAITSSNDAWLFTATASAANVILPVSSSGANTLSVFAKAGTQDGIFIRFSGSSNPRAFFNLSNGTLISSSSITSSNVESFNDGWYRISITSTDNVTDARIYVADSIGNFVSSGNIYVWGAQLEQQSYATSYIPTQGSVVTRLADVCNNGANEQVINSTEGVLYAEIAALANDLSYRTISVSDGTTSNRCVLRYGGITNYINVLIFSGGSTVFDNNYTLSDITDFSKIAVKWKVNDFALWVDGVERKTDTSGSAPIGLSQLQLSNYNNSSNDFYGNTKDVRVYNTALTDLELQQLTTI